MYVKESHLITTMARDRHKLVTEIGHTKPRPPHEQIICSRCITDKTEDEIIFLITVMHSLLI